MGSRIDPRIEFWAKVLIRNGWTDKDVAVAVGCNRKTVRSIRTGRTLRSLWTGNEKPRAEAKTPQPDPDEFEFPAPEKVEPYVCVPCCEATGVHVIVELRPCVICIARRAKADLEANK